MHLLFTSDCQCGIAYYKDGGKGKEGKSQRIYNGKKTQEHQYPWLVYLVVERYQTNETECGTKEPGFGWKLRVRCSGSLISNKHVLTNAHCFQRDNFRFNYTTDRAYIVYGLYWTCSGLDRCEDPEGNENKGIKEVRKYFLHPKYTVEDDNYDVAIIKIKGKITFSAAVRPICLPNNKNKKDTYIKKVLTVTGYGSVNTVVGIDKDECTKQKETILKDKEASHAHEAKMLVQKCPKKSETKRRNGKNRICMQGHLEPRKICKGDSGSPAFLEENHR